MNQVLVCKKEEGRGREIRITNQPQKTTSDDAYLIEDYGVFPINHVLIIPPQLFIVLKDYINSRDEGMLQRLSTVLKL
ncbi:beta-ig-h3 fasciclin [Moniliophthora roreri]|nr:beta-ig-h3 fasciclin [Moniliophthora roreri]